jgi:multisubunit Na+/H+ antiporter MnhF subunit
VEVIPLARLFHSVVLDSQKALSEMEYLWVYAMLFSTIVPTLLHAALALFSLESLMPERLRDWFHRILASDDEFETLAGLLSLSLLTTTCLFLPVYLVYRLLAAIVTVAPEFLHYYLGWLTSIACHIGPQHCPA